MTTTTAAGRLRSAAVIVLGLAAAPALAHPGEGQTPYRYGLLLAGGLLAARRRRRGARS